MAYISKLHHTNYTGIDYNLHLIGFHYEQAVYRTNLVLLKYLDIVSSVMWPLVTQSNVELISISPVALQFWVSPGPQVDH